MRADELPAPPRASRRSSSGFATCACVSAANTSATSAFQMRYSYVFAFAEKRAWKSSATVSARITRMSGGRSWLRPRTQSARRDLERRVEVRALRERVHAGVGAARAVNAHVLLRRSSPAPPRSPAARSSAFVCSLPPAVARAEILEREQHAHRCRLVRPPPSGLATPCVISCPAR